MAAIDFPASPTTGDLFSVSATGVTYRWNGTLWLVQAGPGGGTGDFYATQSAVGAINTTGAVMVFPTVVTGNSGAYYNASNGRYTPPAGRYYIYTSATYNSTTSLIGNEVTLRKNGVAIVYSFTSASPPEYTQTLADGVFDANGTDYFDVFLRSSSVVPSAGSGSQALYFGAFPLTGMQGLPGLSGGSTALVTISDTAPVGPLAGTMWWNSVLGTLFFYYSDVDSSQWVPASPAAASSQTPLDGYLYGLTLSNNSTTGINFAPGKCADSNNIALITNTTSMNKLISATWAAGDGAGGRGTGVARTASTWYHMFGGLVGGAFDAFYDTSVVGANAPAGFTNIRRLGSIRTSTGGTPPIIAFNQDGDNFWWATEVDDPTGTATGLIALTVPPGVRVMWQGNVYLTTPAASTTNVWFSTPGVAQSTSVTAPMLTASAGNGAIAASILTNTARQILVTVFSSGGTGTFWTETRGWADTRGRNG